jgi:hypothetical protein
MGLPCQFCLPREPSWTSVRVCRDPWPRRLPAHPSSLLSIAHTRSLSPAPFHASSPSFAAVSAIQLVRSRAEPPRAPSRGEASVPVLDSPYLRLTIVNLAPPEFGRAYSPRPARCPANSASPHALRLAHSAPLPPPELDRALSHTIASPYRRDSSPELPPTRPELSLYHSPIPAPGLVARTPPVCLPGSPY